MFSKDFCSGNLVKNDSKSNDESVPREFVARNIRKRLSVEFSWNLDGSLQIFSFNTKVL